MTRRGIIKVVVLGAGRIGYTIVSDLANDSQFRVSVADRDTVHLKRLEKETSVKTLQANLSDPACIKKVMADCDVVIDALPGSFGYQAFQTAVELGKHIVDIAFFPEDPFSLNDLAKSQNIVAAVDCGVAPGMSNLFVGFVDHLLDETDNVQIYVGGLPIARKGLYEYKAAWSPIDVIEEYTRPARYVENGKLVSCAALSDSEIIDIPSVGTFEAFNTDGLRTLAHTIHAPSMREKTLRYPGHVEKIALLKDTGFFSKKEIDINGQKIRPLDLTAKILLPLWELKEGEEDMTVMRILVEGKKDGRKLRYTYDLHDCYDRSTHTTSMARTTGYTATQVVRLLASGLYDQTGVSPLELVGRNPKYVDFILQGLKQRGVVYKETITTI